MASKSLEQIADLQGCSYQDAQEFCEQVRVLCNRSPSTTSILSAVMELEQLEEPYTLQKVASLATKLHQQELAKRPPRRILRPSRLRRSFRGEPRFIIDEYGTVLSNNPKNREIFRD